MVHFLIHQVVDGVLKYFPMSEEARKSIESPGKQQSRKRRRRDHDDYESDFIHDDSSSEEEQEENDATSCSKLSGHDLLVQKTLDDLAKNLYKELNKIGLPKLHPLDELINALGGPAHVAEMTGELIVKEKIVISNI